MSRTFDQILSDVTAQSDPQRKIVLGQIADLPNQQAAQTSALNAQKDQAYQDITSQAQQRGLGFSGIPLGEQAKYNATTYAPALANLGTSFNNQKSTLEGALAGIGQNNYSTANDVFNQERNFGEQQRQFNANLAAQQAASRAAAAQSAAWNSVYGNGQQAPQPAQQPGGQGVAHAQAVKRADGGFNYTDQNGKAINAAQYAHITGQKFRDVLQQAAAHGDAGSKAALAFVGNDYGYNPNLIKNQALANLYNSLTGRNAVVYKPPGPSVHDQVMGTVNHLLSNNIFTGYNNSGAQKALAAQKAAHGGHL